MPLFVDTLQLSPDNQAITSHFLEEASFCPSGMGTQGERMGAGRHMGLGQYPTNVHLQVGMRQGDLSVAVPI